MVVSNLFSISLVCMPEFKQSICEEYHFVRPDGRVDWVRWEILPWKDLEGKIGILNGTH